MGTNTTDGTHAPTPPESGGRLATLLKARAVRAVYQPIVDLQRGEVIGYECLSRPGPASGFAHVGELFDDAAKLGRLWDLEQLTRGVSLRAREGRMSDALVFFNTSPSVFADERFAPSVERLVAECGLRPSRVVLEITERAETDVEGALARNVERLKIAGFQIAIDDVGAGTSGLNRIMALRPQWLKLDRELVERVDADPFRQNLIDFLLNFARISGVRVIAEGIERAAELTALVDLGVGYGQGFLLGRPGEPGAPIAEDVRSLMRDRRRRLDGTHKRSARTITVAEVMRQAVTADALCTAKEAALCLRAGADAGGLVVIDESRILGWCPRRRCLDAGESSPASTLASLVRPGAPPVEPHAPLLDALRAGAAQADSEGMDPMIVADQGGVVGVVTVPDLLRGAVRMGEGGRAFDGSLTGLQGRAACDRCLTTMLQDGVQGEAAFIDIIDFGRFNRAFGYELGDVLLRLLSGLIAATIGSLDDAETHLAAHLGDDRFLVVTVGEPVEPIVRRIAEEFERAADRFLSIQDEGLVAAMAEQAAPSGSVRGWGLAVSIVGDIARAAMEPRELHALGARIKATLPSPRRQRTCILKGDGQIAGRLAA